MTSEVAPDLDLPRRSVDLLATPCPHGRHRRQCEAVLSLVHADGWFAEYRGSSQHVQMSRPLVGWAVLCNGSVAGLEVPVLRRGESLPEAHLVRRCGGPGFVRFHYDKKVGVL